MSAASYDTRTKQPRAEDLVPPVSKTACWIPVPEVQPIQMPADITMDLANRIIFDNIVLPD